MFSHLMHTLHPPYRPTDTHEAQQGRGQVLAARRRTDAAAGAGVVGGDEPAGRVGLQGMCVSVACDVCVLEGARKDCSNVIITCIHAITLFLF